METIINYLHNPMKIGVYNHLLIVDFSKLIDYIKETAKASKESYKKIKSSRIPKEIFQSRLSALNEAIDNLDESWSREKYFSGLRDALETWVRLSPEDAPDLIRGLFYRERIMETPSGRKIIRRIQIRRRSTLFDSCLVPEANDVISIEKTNITENKWLFDIVSIKEGGPSAFMSVLESLPTISKQMKVLKKKKYHSSRYVFRTYPLAVNLWLQDIASQIVASDLKSFLEGAIRYITSEEWRTSIVLSAIAVESVLADLYEEEFKESAPDVPLGNLLNLIKDRARFPPDVLKAINIANEARIAAVHRSRVPVSDVDATNALFGATNLIHWYSSQSD